MKSHPGLRNIVATTLIPHTAFQTATKRITQCCRYGGDSNEPVGIALIGESRTGKSRLLEECGATFPKVRDEEGINLPILIVSTPSKPTVKGLASEMLKAIGDPMHTSGTEISMTSRLSRLLKEIGTKMLIIDEFQHFYDKGTHQIMHHVADWLKILVDDTKVVLVVAGLPTCRQVIDQNEQLAGRFLAPLVMPRFDWSDTELREEFVAILEAFGESLSMHFDVPDMAAEEMAFRFYCATGGLMGYVTRLLRQMIWNALENNSRLIDLGKIEQAQHDCFWRLKDLPKIEAFSKSFKPEATDALLNVVAQIGTRQIPDPKGKGGLRMKASPSFVLSAS